MQNHNNPLISIIVPTFNRSQLLKDTLQSVIMQKYENWECIIVDDGSIDDTEYVVREFATKDDRFQYHNRPDNYKSGGNGSRNYGFEVSKGEYVNWFDDDDIMLPNFLIDKVEVLNSRLALVISSGYYWNPENNSKKLIDLSLKHSLYQDYALWQTHILTPSILFKKDFLRGKDLFSDKILRGQETELYSRLFFQMPENQFSILNIPSFLYRQHEDTKSFQNRVYNSEFVKSEVFNAIEKFKRSTLLDNKILLRHAYREILIYLTRSIKNRDFDNVDYILKTFHPILNKYNVLVNYQFKILGKVSYNNKLIFHFSARYLRRLI